MKNSNTTSFTHRIRRKRIAAVKKHAIYISFLLPAFLLFAFAVLIPFFQGVPYSFTNWKSIISDSRDFVGLKNYITLLTNKFFLKDFVHTLHFTALYILAANGLGLFLALLLWKSSKFNNFVRTVAFMPFTVALVSSAIVWTYLYTDLYTPLFNLPSPLGVSSQVVNGLVVIAVWRDMGYCMLIYIAALQSIPYDYYEAAKVEGANFWHETIHITIPMLVPAFSANVTLLLAWGLRCFDYPMAAARNMAAAETTAMFVYDNIFGFNKAGLGQTAAILITVFLLILTVIVTRLFRKVEVEA